jgi:hypothetical protein
MKRTRVELLWLWRTQWPCEAAIPRRTSGWASQSASAGPVVAVNLGEKFGKGQSFTVDLSSDFV